MSNKRIDLTLYEGHTKGDPNDNPDSWRVVGDGFVMNGTSPQPRYIGYIRHSNFQPDIPAKREPLSEADAKLIADAPRLLAELKRYYGFVDELLDYFHHTILENESFMDLMYRMGVFEFEPEPWQNEKGEWMMFVGDTYETGEWVVDKDFTPNQEE